MYTIIWSPSAYGATQNWQSAIYSEAMAKYKEVAHDYHVRQRVKVYEKVKGQQVNKTDIFHRAAFGF